MYGNEDKQYHKENTDCHGRDNLPVLLPSSKMGEPLMQTQTMHTQTAYTNNTFMHGSFLPNSKQFIMHVRQQDQSKIHSFIARENKILCIPTVPTLITMHKLKPRHPHFHSFMANQALPYSRFNMPLPYKPNMQVQPCRDQKGKENFPCTSCKVILTMQT